MSESNAIKSNNAIEHGCRMQGYFAKEYSSYVDIIELRGSLYVRLYKKSTPEAVNKAKDLLDILNAEDSAYEVAQAWAVEREGYAARIQNLIECNTFLRESKEKLQAKASKDANGEIILTQRVNWLEYLLEKQSNALSDVAYSLRDKS